MPDSLAVVAVPLTDTRTLAPQQATSDDQLIELWLHGRSAHTQRAYSADVEGFRAFVQKPLPMVVLGDLHAFGAHIEELAASSRARKLSAVKSLLGFGHRLGYLPFDVGRAMRLPPQKSTLAERIISEADVHRMLALEPDTRNRVLVRLLYAAGLRRSEVSGLRWRDLQAREHGGQVTAYGKGSKTRAVLLPVSVWTDLVALRGDDGPDEPVFRSRTGGPLSSVQIWRVVRQAARRAGISVDVSPHFMRHAHASHSLDRGAPIHLVQATLGHASVATTGRYLHASPTESSSKYLAV